MGLVCEAALPDQRVEGPLAIANEGVVPRDVRPMRLWWLNAAGIRAGVQRTYEEGQPEARTAMTGALARQQIADDMSLSTYVKSKVRGMFETAGTRQIVKPTNVHMLHDMKRFLSRSVESMTGKSTLEETGMATMDEKPERIWFLDWIRVFGCLAVVLLHCLVSLSNNMPMEELGVTRALVWTEVMVFLTRWAVPAFLMITGALLLDPNRSIGKRKLRSYVARIGTVLLVFGTAFSLMEYIYTERTLNVQMILASLMDLIQGKGWGHLWYLFDLLGIYLLLPMFRAFIARHDDRKSLELLLKVLFMLTLVVPTVNRAFDLSIDTLIWLNSSAFYVFLGWYLMRYEVPLTPVVAFGTLGISIAAFIAAVGILVCGSYLSWAWETSSPLIAPWAAMVFVLAKKRANRPMKSGGLAITLSTLSFAIYVLHPVIVNFMYKILDLTPDFLPPIVFEASAFAVVVLLSMFASMIARRLPVIGKCL